MDIFVILDPDINKRNRQTNRQKQRKRTGIHIQNNRINIQKKIRQKEASVLDEQQTEKFAKRFTENNKWKPKSEIFKNFEILSNSILNWQHSLKNFVRYLLYTDPKH